MNVGRPCASRLLDDHIDSVSRQNGSFRLLTNKVIFDNLLDGTDNRSRSARARNSIPQNAPCLNVTVPIRAPRVDDGNIGCQSRDGDKKLPGKRAHH